MSRFSQRLLLWCLLLAAAAALAGYRLKSAVKLEADIVSVLPQSSYSETAQAALNRYLSPMQQRVNFVFSHPDPQQLVAAVSAFDQQTRTWLQLQQQPSQSQFALGLGQLFAGGSLLSAEYAALIQASNVETIVEQAYTQLSMPGNSLAAELLPYDPLLLSVNFLNQFSQQSGSQLTPLQVVSPAANLHHQIVSGALIGDVAQTQQVQQIEAVISQLQTEYSNLQVIRSGFAFHAAKAEQSAKGEMQWLGGFALLGIVSLVISVFRSIMPLALSLLCVLSSILAGLTVLVSIFDSVHLLTFVFAVSLIGIAIDYGLHFFVQRNQQLQQPEQAERTFFKALLSSLLTTVLGYLLLFWAPMTLLQQVAIFMVAGLLTAYLFIRWVAQASQWQRQSYNRLSKVIVKGYSSISSIVAKKRLVWGGCLIFALTLAGVSHSNKLFQDSIQLLIHKDPSLVEQGQQWQALTQQQWETAFLLVSGDTQQQVWYQSEAVNKQLTLLKQSGKLAGYFNLASLIPSPAAQQQHQALVAQMLRQPSVQGYFANLGLEPNDYYKSERTLTFEDLFTKPGFNHFANLWLQQSSVSNVIMLQKVADWSAIQQLVASEPNLQLIDRPQDVSAVLSKFRQTLMWLFPGMLLVACLYLSWQFGWQRGLFAVAIVLCAIQLALLLSYWTIGHLNIFNLFACLLIIALGLDYVIFYAHNIALDKVKLAVVLSSLSSLLGFGLLAFSATPVVASFGLTVMFGILALTLLSPSIRLDWDHKCS